MKRPRLKAILQNLALAAGTFVLCFLALEVVLRLAGYGNLEIYSADPVLYWRLKPNQNCFTKVDRKPVRVNSLGTRRAEFEPRKPPGALRILALGDSRTFGWGLTEAESYAGRVEKMLQEHMGPARKVEVINAGVNGWSFAQMHAYFREYGRQYQPDMVVLAEANFWTQFSDDNHPEFVRSFMRRVWLKNFLRRFAAYHYVVEYKLKDVYERTRHKFVPLDPKQDTFFKDQQQKDLEAFYLKHIEATCALAISNGIKPVLLFLPMIHELANPEPTPVLKAKTQVSQRLNVPLVDLTSDLKPKGKELFLEGDHAHLNAPGNELISQRLFPTLLNLITHEQAKHP